jgi:2-polyprenyl-3-methyl-5-hydroxy-6-metoxy-1,4-benzoquinol methylase
MSQEKLQEQIAYYNARANEYDEWFYRISRYDRGKKLNQLWFDEAAIVKKSLQNLGTFQTVLELACGTGIWTKELVAIAQEIVAIDASQETIAINQKKVNSAKVEYQQLDLFTWQPTKQYDLVFFAFWLSHVPPDKIDKFLDKVSESVKPGGRIFIIDSRFSETSSAKNHCLQDEKAIQQIRRLNDGREFQVFKVYYQPDELLTKLNRVGFQADLKITDNYFIYGSGVKNSSTISLL